MPKGLSDAVGRNTAEIGIGWITLCLVFLASLVQGGNHPAVWTPLSLVVTLLLAMLVLLRLGHPLPAALRGAILPAALLGTVVTWALAQAILGVPPAVAHPVWSLAPEGSSPRISADPAATVHGVLRLATYAMLGWILAVAALQTSCAWALLRAIGFAVAAMALFALCAAAIGVNPLLGTYAGLGGRVSGAFVNSNSMATYAAFGMLVNLGLFAHAPLAARRGKLVFALCCALCAACVVLTGSRGGTLSALIGVAVFVAALKGRRQGGLAALVSVLAGLAGTVAMGLVAAAGHPVARALDDSMAGRAHVYGAVIAQLETRPWLGHGLGAFQDTFRPYVPIEASRREWEMAHSSYLENLWEMGAPTALVFYAALALVGRRLWIGLGVRSRDAAIPALALAVFTAGAVHAAVDFSLQMPACAGLFAVLLGIGWAQSFGHAGRTCPGHAHP
ncbi:MAG: O-antigen ligase family protein [Pseudomonadota bacterium]